MIDIPAQDHILFPGVTMGDQEVPLVQAGSDNLDVNPVHVCRVIVLLPGIGQALRPCSDLYNIQKPQKMKCFTLL